MQLFTSDLLAELLGLHRAIDEAPERPGCLDTDPEVFFAEKPFDYSAARQICRECPVISQCAEYAIKWEYDGFFGGLTPRQRSKIRNLATKARRDIA